MLSIAFYIILFFLSFILFLIIYLFAKKKNNLNKKTFLNKNFKKKNIYTKKLYFPFIIFNIKLIFFLYKFNLIFF